MQNNCDLHQCYELICVIVDFDFGSKVLKIAKQNGISGGTVYLGRGTVHNRILDLLGLTDSRKEIVIMMAERNKANAALEEINNKFHFKNHHHGIAFTTSVLNILGSRNCQCNMEKESRGVEETMYDAIYVIVDKGNAETAVEAAVKAGSRGGTIINARGSGVHETSRLFSMEIEPEKEIVLILSEKQMTDAITASIAEQLQIDKPGNGIIFVQDVSKTYGIY